MADFINAFANLVTHLFPLDQDTETNQFFINQIKNNKNLDFDLTRLLVLKYLILKLGSSDILPPNLKLLSDLSFFYSMTANHFISEDFNPFDVTVHIRECDLTNPDRIYQHTPLSNEEQLAQLSKVILSKTKFN